MLDHGPSRGREEDFSIGALRDFASSHSIFAFADRLARVQEQQASSYGKLRGPGGKDAVCVCQWYWCKSSGDVQAHESLGRPAG